MTISSTLAIPINYAHDLSNGLLHVAKDTIVSVGGTVASNAVVGSLLERALIRLMESQIKYGQLTLVLPSDKSYTFGTASHPDQLQKSDIRALRTGFVSDQQYGNSVTSSTSSVSGHHVAGTDTPPTSIDASSPKFGSSATLSHLTESAEEARPRITIHVKSSTFFFRLLLSGDLGFAESYMAGECDVYYTREGEEEISGQQLEEGYYGEAVEGAKGEREGEQLLDLFKIAIRSDHPAETSSKAYHLAHPTTSAGSKGIGGGLNSLPANLFSAIASYTTSSRIVNSVRNSVGNIRAHYDISNRMFSSFLSSEMTYSCAIFPTLDGDLVSSPGNDHTFNPIYLPGSYPAPASQQTTDALESAQYAKLHHIIKKAKIQRGHRVIEIGSGWGSCAIEAVKLTGCTVDTLTLSTQQKILAEERIKAAGLQDSITVHLMDFRSIPDSWKHSFDRLISIEMLEAVGKEYIEPYFKMIDEVLNEKGVAVFQVITIPESRFENYSANVDFIQKWIFPGGFLPSVAFTTEMIKKGSQNRLTIDSVVNIGPHYARTLREWRIRFLKNFDRDIRPALKDEHPEMTPADVEVFKRKWIYYFIYCEVGFAERLIGDHIFSLTREGNTQFGSDIYI